VNGHINKNPNTYHPLLTPKAIKKTITPSEPLTVAPHLLIITTEPNFHTHSDFITNQSLVCWKTTPKQAKKLESRN